jgi:conjugal transfer pilus assembly protein TraE
MDAATHRSDLLDLKRANALQRIAIVALIFLSILMMLKISSQQTTVIAEPPSRAQAISMTGDRVDAAWLEEMGLWVAHLMLDVTPQSVPWQREQVLRMTHPEIHGDLEQRMVAQAKRLIESNATTSFWPQQVAPDPDGQQTLLMGRLDTYVNGTRTSSATTAYRVSFRSKGGRILIKDWTEVPTDDPWLLKAAERALKAEKTKGGSK